MREAIWGGTPTNVSIDRSTAARLLSASTCPRAKARRNAAAVLGYFASQVRVTA